MEYKRNQIEEAIFRIFGAREERCNELKFRIKRLLVTDRRLGRNVKSAKEEDQHYAFFGQEPGMSRALLKMENRALPLVTLRGLCFLSKRVVV
jgi:hypothetical protein